MPLDVVSVGQVCGFGLAVHPEILTNISQKVSDAPFG
jgi:hypothetical protein